MDHHKYRFDVKNTRTGNQEPYIGVFKSRMDAEAWFIEHGLWHRKNDRPLILVKCPTKNPEAPIEEEEDR
jgi:hypothetical protein